MKDIWFINFSIFSILILDYPFFPLYAKHKAWMSQLFCCKDLIVNTQGAIKILYHRIILRYGFHDFDLI